MLRRTLAATALALAASAAAFGQTNADEARKELDAGARAYRNGRFAEAEQRFRRALELDPEGKNTRIFIARAVQQQYKPGVQTPENLAAGERAVAAYQEVLAQDPANEDAYKAVVFLYGQMKNEEKVNELLLQSANNFSFSNQRRAEAFVILASKQWSCSYDITEQKENKTTEQKENKVLTRYKMPADPGDFIRARQCLTEGLQLAEQAVALAPQNANAWSYKSNLLREAAKLSEMEGDTAGQAEYMRQHEEALEKQKQTALEEAKSAEQQGNAPAGTSPPDPPRPSPRSASPGAILNAKALSKPQPAYPPEALAAGVQGTVTVRVVLDEEGKVIEAVAISGPEPLRAAAVAAARQARFTQTLLSGVPVKTTGSVTYRFVLPPKTAPGRSQD